MPPASEPLRILLAGLGNRGKMWASIVDQSADATLSGVVDVDPAALDTFAASNPGLPAIAGIKRGLSAAGLIGRAG